MFGGPRLVGSAPGGGYGSSGSVLYVRPPDWESGRKSSRPVLFGFPELFSPLAQATSRGMKETVGSLLRHHASKHHHYVDHGYKEEVPSGMSLSPLQIASMNYTGSTQSKFLEIIRMLVTYGASIHHATFWVQEPDPSVVDEHRQAVLRLTQARAAIAQVQSTIDVIKRRLAAMQQMLAERFGTLIPAEYDQSEQLRLDRDLDTYEERKEAIVETAKQLSLNVADLGKAIQRRRMINASPYAIALKMRHTCSDTAIVEAMVDGAIDLKDSIFSAFPPDYFAEETVQIVVEYCVGLSLRKWDV